MFTKGFTDTYASILKLASGALLSFAVLIFIRRRYFSSISDIPGPFLGSFSVLWQIVHAIKGHTEEETIAEHKKHGRMPNQLLTDQDDC